MYTGKACETEVRGLLPNTPYTYKLRAYTEGDESPFSDTVSIITEESGKLLFYIKLGYNVNYGYLNLRHVTSRF